MTKHHDEFKMASLHKLANCGTSYSKKNYRSFNIGPQLIEHEILLMQHSLKWVSLIEMN